MILSPQQRDKMQRATRGAAIAFLEDIQHFHEILNRDQISAPEIRRASVALRRLLNDRELNAVAAPRIGRFIIEMPQPPLPHPTPPVIFVRGGAPLGSLTVADAAIYPRALSDTEMKALHRPEVYSPDVRIAARIDNFLSAEVLYYAGLSITRGQVILFVANVASGAHSGTPKEAHERVLAIIRRVAKVNNPDTGKSLLHVNPDNFREIDAPLQYSANEIDAVLFELMCTMFFLVNSESTTKLEAVVREEIGLKP